MTNDEMPSDSGRRTVDILERAPAELQDTIPPIPDGFGSPTSPIETVNLERPSGPTERLESEPPKALPAGPETGPTVRLPHPPVARPPALAPAPPAALPPAPPPPHLQKAPAPTGLIGRLRGALQPVVTPVVIPPGLTFLAEGGTDRGPRERNDDTWLVGDNLLVVADGVGGKPAGKQAADLAVRTLRDTLKNTADPGQELVRAVELAHNIILEHGRRDPTKSQMSCTLDAVMVHGEDQLFGVHVGDSRAYVCVSGRPAEQTTADEAMDGLLLQSLGGVTTEIHPRVWSCRVQPGDRVVLATDGLWSALDDVTVAALVTGTRFLSPENATRTLISVALAAGATDNITLIVADVAPVPMGASRAAALERRLR